MAIAFILHEATRTGAPKLGGLIARELAAGEDVRVIVMKDGPLGAWLTETVGARNLTICRGEPFDYRRPFEERLRLAEDMLSAEPADVVYVNSLASGVFALAAAALKRKTILHVHEKYADIVSLLAHDVAKLEVMGAADALVLAADDIRADLSRVFRAAPAEVQTFGIAVEVEAIRAAALERATPPLNARGQPLAPGGRLLVGMCGHASYRKGVDIFFDVAAATPACDFLWVGGFRPREASENVAFAEFNTRALPNFFISGAVENPFPYLRMMDLFFLSSREDPNPLVLAEALALQRPLLCFSQTTAIADRLGRCAIVCYGKPNVADAARVIGACSAETLRRPEFQRLGDAFVAEYDLRAKMGALRDLIARLRGETPPPATQFETPGAVPHYLETGVVELTFS